MMNVDEVYTSVILAKNKELAEELNYLANLMNNLPDTLKDSSLEQEAKKVLDNVVMQARSKIAIPLLGIEKANELNTEESVIRFVRGLICNQMF